MKCIQILKGESKHKNGQITDQTHRHLQETENITDQGTKVFIMHVIDYTRKL